MKACDTCDGRLQSSQEVWPYLQHDTARIDRIPRSYGVVPAELGRRPELSPSRLADYETGFTRGQERRPAPIPKVVELACAGLEEHGKKQPLSDAEWLSLLRSLAVSEAVIEDDRREAIYSPPRDL